MKNSSCFNVWLDFGLITYWQKFCKYIYLTYSHCALYIALCKTFILKMNDVQ